MHFTLWHGWLRRTFLRMEDFLQEEQAFLQGKVLTENTSNVKYISAKGIYFSIGTEIAGLIADSVSKGLFLSSVQFKKFPRSLIQIKCNVRTLVRLIGGTEVVLFGKAPKQAGIKYNKSSVTHV